MSYYITDSAARNKGNYAKIEDYSYRAMPEWTSKANATSFENGMVAAIVSMRMGKDGRKVYTSRE